MASSGRVLAVFSYFNSHYSSDFVLATGPKGLGSNPAKAMDF
jgi:hypothetical protein